MNKKAEPLIVLALIHVIILNVATTSASWISITVQIDKTVYNVGEEVTVNGTVIFDGQPLTNALVAIEIDDRAIPILYRTVNTGSDPTGPFKIEILNAFLGDINRNPVTNAKVGSTYYLWIVYKNNEANPVKAGLTFTIVDSSNSPMFAVMLRLGDLPTGGPWYDGCQWAIPSDAKLGTATVYGSAYTEYPKNGGIPHCPEKSSTFNIVATLSTSQLLNQSETQTIQTNGSYSLKFNIPNTNARLGNYTVYATTFQWDLTDMETTIFTVILLGDINGDLIVNAKDAVIIGRAFGSSQGDPNYNSNADLNKDGQINAKDAIIVGANFGNSGI